MTAQPRSTAGAPAPGVTIDMIVDLVCDALDRSRDAVIGGDDRSSTTLLARHVAMWLARRLMGLPHAEIGRLIGGREAGTVINAEARINARAASDPIARAELTAIEVEVRAAGATAEWLGLAITPGVDAVRVARRIMGDARAATQVSVAEIEALAAYVLQSTQEPDYV